eukprot:UN04196
MTDITQQLAFTLEFFQNLEAAYIPSGYVYLNRWLCTFLFYCIAKLGLMKISNYIFDTQQRVNRTIRSRKRVYRLNPASFYR